MTEHRSWRLRVVASDLDGTLLARDGTVSPRTRSALDRAREAGVHIVAVTGRPPRWLDPLADDLGPGEAICANGAIVVHLPSGEVLAEHQMAPDVAREVMARLRTALPEVAFSVEHGRGWARERAWVRLLDERRAPPEEAIVPTADDLVAHGGAAKILAWAPGQRGDHLIETATAAVGELGVVTASGAQELVEVSAVGVTKASSLAALCRDLDVDPADVVAFGDARNDVPMLEWAGYGVAVADAHPSALSVADEVVASCEHDGVAEWLERHLP